MQVVPNQILGTLVVRFIKPGFTTDECTKSDGKWVDVAQGQSVPLSALFGNATPLGPIDMLACVFAPAGTQVDALFLNVTSIP